MANSSHSEDRRRFLRVAVIGGVGMVAAGAGSASVFMPPSAVRAGEPGPRPLMPMIRLGGLEADEPLGVELTLSVRDGWRLRTRRQRVYVVRTGDGDEPGAFRVLTAVCPHAGCTIQWNEPDKQFVCPCHGARFDPRGEDNSDPAPRPMDALDISVAEHEGRPWLFVEWQEFEAGNDRQIPRAQA